MSETKYTGTQRWFGARFDTPMYAEMPEVLAPIGEPCGYCEEPILEGEPGLMMPFVTGTDADGWKAVQTGVHVECSMRAVLGSPQHRDGQCSCYTGHEFKSELTWRQQALVVMFKLWGDNWWDTALKPGQKTLEEKAL